MCKKGIKKMLAMIVAFCLVVSMMPWNALVAIAETTTYTSKTSDFDAAKDEAQAYIEELMKNNDPSAVVKDNSKFFTWDNEKRSPSNKDYLYEWSYYNGIVFEGLDYVYDATGESKYKTYVNDYLSSMITDGKLNDYAGYVSDYGEDCYKTASLLLDYSYKNVAATLYKHLQDAQTDYTSEDIGGNYYHTWSSKPTYAVWLDGLYMTQPFMAKYAASTGDTDELNKIAERFNWVGDNMYNESTGLYYHMANSKTDSNEKYWGSGIGLYAAAMVDVMDDMSGDNLKSMKSQFKKLVDGMVQYQAEDGMWRQFVNNSSSAKETSVTALMAYSIQKAVNQGWLDSSYAKYAQNAFVGMCDYSLDKDGLHYICYNGNDEGYSDVSSSEYVNDGKGVGPFIMAYAEMLKATPVLDTEVQVASEDTASDEAQAVSEDIVSNGIMTFSSNALASAAENTTTTVDKSQPNWGLTAATDYPEYPADGAVRINKTATNGEFAFTETGVTKVELDVAGISVKKGVDVVLVVDVSNSMAWSLNNAGGKTDAQKLPTNGESDKLQNAMKSASNFADILLGANSADGTKASDNTLSFVTFAGNDIDNGGRTDRIDSVKSVFEKVKNSEAAKKAFSNTKFTNKVVTNTQEGKVEYTLQIVDEKGNKVADGINRGNTNYDYAFWQAMKTVNNIQTTGYAESGRETYVVFMTDGAPSHYNDMYTKETNDTIPGTKNKYNYKTFNDASSWYNYINGEANRYARDLYDKVNGNFVSIGFDLAHGGFSGWSWDETQLTSVLKGLAYKNDVNKEIEVFATADADKLSDFYTSLANRIKQAGTDAQVTDTVKSDFDVQMKPFSTVKDSTTDTVFEPKIEVTAYDLVKKSEATNEKPAGTRTGTSSVIEKVTFNEDGTEAYSNQVSGNIMSKANGVTTINAKYFTYTKTADSTEKFVWNVGTITDKELALSYYAYLTGTMENTREEGVYDTNEDAILEYVDINGNYAKKIFPLPKVNWGGAVTTVEYYLANESGAPVNRMGQQIPFANRIIVSEGTYYKFALGETKKVYGAAPTGYQMCNPDAYYTVRAEANGTGDLTIDDTMTFTDIGTSNTMKSTQRVDTDTASYNSTKVAFAVYTFNTQPSNPILNLDKIVIDYGKEIRTDVLENDQDNLTNKNCIAELVGFAKYNATTEKEDVENVQASAGVTKFDGDYGTFTISDDKKVSYQPTKMMNEVEHVYAVVKVTNNNEGGNYYYQYNVLSIIPATMMYYETDFSSSAFTTKTTGSAWVNKEIANDDGTSAVDSPQNDGTIGKNQTYGYDSTYKNDQYLSNGSSYFVEGQGIKLNENTTAYTYADFSFKGTGFDLISRTGAKQGAIRVDIYTDAARKNLAKSVTVLNKSESDLELYQIPVVSVNDLTYGTYYVRIGINAAYNNTNYPALNRGGEFYFDAIRVYNPLNVSNSSTATDDKLAYDAYSADNEADPQVTEVREELIKSGDYDITTTAIDGITFVDRNKGSVDITEYTTIGPNNEVYLKNQQAVAFKVSTDKKPSSFDIGAKSANGSIANLEVVAASSLTDLESSKATVNSTEISTSTSLFYPVENIANAFEYNNTTKKYEAYVFVTNTNTDANSILSITDIKVAYGSGVSASAVSYSVNQEVLRVAAFCLERPEAIEPEEPNYDIQSAEFTSSPCSIFKKATMTVVTTTDVEELKVTNKYGTKMNAEVTSTINEEGMKVWTVKFKPLLLGTQSFTVTGYGADGTEGASATCSIKVKLF